MKYTLFLLALIAISPLAHGQRKKEFYDKNGNACDSVHSTYYKIERKKGDFIVDAMNDKSKTDTVFSYFTVSGKTRAREIYKGQVLNGNFIAYYESGRIQEKGNFYEGDRIGYFLSWYPSGRPQQTVQYNAKPKKHLPNIINYWDSVGKQLVNNGKGFCRCYSIIGEGKILREDGKVLAGVRDSIWRGYTNDTLSFRESYENGDLLVGVRYIRREEFTYANFEQPPEYQGGSIQMMNVIKKNLRYPKQAQRMGTEGKVFVSFVVNKDGTPSDLGIAKGVSNELDQEALRVVGLMKEWAPGRVRGVPVRTTFVMPINFRLN